ncbi:uncharacterized protein A1O5_10103 [Cladophialophora psammophila CBS 110553]|uniref:Nephrocystin 3-like N-terminal domain-containing protein n=1 Tax=Cladophialophora psammophila CBS 110553 TaxID=1182543 RepID=W9WG75_9EURO|nr:uncharacterized protein A1O5_10103 [Cladophialophora psammophila CBS 110553]EXJ66908.1 hypothetical protein A1O5_10103 [Cladophialophora psammophila CBS 110553]
MDTTASVIAIVELSVTITWSCMQYARDVARASEESADLCKKIGNLQIVLVRLQTQSKAGELLAQIQPALNACNDDLLKLKKKVGTTTGLGGGRPIAYLALQEANYLRALDHVQRGEHVEIMKEVRNPLTPAPVLTIPTVAKDWLKWLGASDLDTLLVQNTNLLQPGTGNWFAKGDIFENWLTCAIPIHTNLWLAGQAGAGKSVLMSVSMTAENINPSITSTKNCVAYFFFDFREPEKQQSQTMLRSLLHQAAIQCHPFPDFLRQLPARFTASHLVPISELVSLLLRVLELFDTSFIFVDALDECDNRDEIFSALEDLVGCPNAGTIVRLICSSRDELDIRRRFDPYNFHREVLSPTVVDNDIAIYVKGLMEEDPRGRYKKLRQGTKDRIVDDMKAKAGGMFLWAQCQLEQLSRCRTDRDIEVALSQLPSTMDATYNRIFSSMDPFDHKRALRALTWLAAPYGSMTLGMLAESLTLDLYSFEIDDSDRLDDAEDILDVCRSLVSISDIENRPIHWKIMLAHFTVEQLIRWDVYLRLAKACMLYATSPAWRKLEESEQDSQLTDREAEDMHFLAYTSVSVFCYLRDPGVEMASLPFLIRTLQNSQAFTNYKKNCSVLEAWESLESEDFPIRYSLTDIPLRSDLTKQENLDILLAINHGSSIVSKAVAYGLLDFAWRLIGAGIDCDTYDSNMQTPLGFLVWAGPDKHFQRLLNLVRSNIEDTESNSQLDAQVIWKSNTNILGTGLPTAIKTDAPDRFDKILEAIKHYFLYVGQKETSRARFQKIMTLASIFSVQVANEGAFQKLLDVVRQGHGFEHDSRNLLLQKLLYAS